MDSSGSSANIKNLEFNFLPYSAFNFHFCTSRAESNQCSLKRPILNSDASIGSELSVGC